MQRAGLGRRAEQRADQRPVVADSPPAVIGGQGKREIFKGCEPDPSVHASTSGLVTGLDARRQTGRIATTTVDQSDAVRRVHHAVSEKADCPDEARCRRLTDEILIELAGSHERFGRTAETTPSGVLCAHGGP
jgi:hypothetical protein